MPAVLGALGDALRGPNQGLARPEGEDQARSVQGRNVRPREGLVAVVVTNKSKHRQD